MIRALFFSVLFSASCMASDRFDLSRHDQELHMVGSLFGSVVLGSAMTFVTNDRIVGALSGGIGMILIGAVKETQDSFFSKGDLTADAVGSGIGTAFTFVVWSF